MTGAVNREVRVYPDLESLSREVAGEIIRLAQAATAERGLFTLALAGGQTPRTLYRLLAREYREEVPWSQVHLFWGDERYVPQEHPQSNYRMVREALLEEVPLPAENVHPMPTHFSDPEDAAQAYEATLRTYFPGAWPDFDLIILGVGVDGHTASLFPGFPALEERRRWVVAVRAQVEPSLRLSLTLAAISHAHHTFFLVSGAEKRGIVQRLLKDPEASKRYPAAMVRPEGRVVWFTDSVPIGKV